MSSVFPRSLAHLDKPIQSNMKTISILLLSCRVIRLNIKIVKQLGEGKDPATLKKDLELLMMLLKRLLAAFNSKLSAERIKNGTTAARKRALKLG